MAMGRDQSASSAPVSSAGWWRAANPRPCSGSTFVDVVLWGGKSRAPHISDAEGVPDLLWLVLTAVLAWLRPRRDLVAENLLLRHQLAVLTRPTRTRPRARPRAWDKLLWVLARRWCAGWREHLAFVTPDTVVRWQRQGWRLFGAGSPAREVAGRTSALKCGS